MAEKTIAQYQDGDALKGNDLILIDREVTAGVRRFFSIAGDQFLAGASGTFDFTASSSMSAAAGSFYFFGGTEFSGTDANLTQAAPTQTFGTALSMRGMRAFVVVAAVGTSDKTTGAVELEVSGISVDDSGVVAADTEAIIVDIEGSDVITDAYFETTKRWVGQITFTIQNNPSGDAVNFALDFNFGTIQYSDSFGLDAKLEKVQVEGLCNTSDSGFEIILHRKTTSDWSYSAAAFTGRPNTPVDNSATNLAPDNQIFAGENFNYTRTGISLKADSLLNPAINDGWFVIIKTSVVQPIDNLHIVVGIKFS